MLPTGGETLGGLQTAFFPTGQVMAQPGQFATDFTEQDAPFSATNLNALPVAALEATLPDGVC